MAKAITAEPDSDLPVWIFADNPIYRQRRGDKQGLTEVLEKQGFSYTIVPRGTDDTYRSVIEKQFIRAAARRWWRHWISPVQREAAEIVGGSSVYGKYISGLYGVRDDAVPAGSAPDKGTTSGLVVTNQFDAGYLRSKAVQAIEKSRREASFHWNPTI